MEALDLVQLHCPPTEVFYNPEVFAVLDDLVQAGKIRNYGVSVEKVEEALKAIEYPGVKSVQIIFNIFRQRPADLFFTQAKRRQVGILARLPLSSGMLAGKMTRQAQFAPDDHRARQPPGRVVRPRRDLFRRGFRNRFAGRRGAAPTRPARCHTWRSLPCAGSWMFDAVTCAIPGAKRPRRLRKISPPPTCLRSAPRRCRQCG